MKKDELLENWQCIISAILKEIDWGQQIIVIRLQDIIAFADRLSYVCTETNLPDKDTGFITGDMMNSLFPALSQRPDMPPLDEYFIDNHDYSITFRRKGSSFPKR